MPLRYHDWRASRLYNGSPVRPILKAFDKFLFSLEADGGDIRTINRMRTVQHLRAGPTINT